MMSEPTPVLRGWAGDRPSTLTVISFGRNRARAAMSPPGCRLSDFAALSQSSIERLMSTTITTPVCTATP